MKLGRFVNFVCPETGESLTALVVRVVGADRCNLAVFHPGEACPDDEQPKDEGSAIDIETTGERVDDEETSGIVKHDIAPSAQEIVHFHAVKYCAEKSPGTFHNCNDC
jgi:hypothetical protein